MVVKEIKTLTNADLYDKEDLARAEAYSQKPLWRRLNAESRVALAKCCERCGISFWDIANQFYREGEID